MKQKNDLVSIIVPVFNAEKEIEQCINSILGQTYLNIELILINDGSTDSSGKICEKYFEQNKKIKYINVKNGGVSKARNLGIENALGKYICFIDSDDFIDEKCIEQLIKNTDNNILVMCNIQKFYKENIKNMITQEVELKYYSKDKFLKLYKERLMNSPIARLYKKSIIDENNIRFDESLSLGEDLLFNFEYLKNIDEIILIDNVFYYYRQGNGNSLSNKYFIDMLDIQKRLCKEFCEFFKENSDKDKANEIVNFCTTIVSNEFHNTDCNIIKRYFNARKLLNNKYIKEKIEQQKGYISKISYFLLSNKLYICYKLLKDVKGVNYE